MSLPQEGSDASKTGDVLKMTIDELLHGITTRGDLLGSEMHSKYTVVLNARIAEMQRDVACEERDVARDAAKWAKWQAVATAVATAIAITALLVAVL